MNSITLLSIVLIGTFAQLAQAKETAKVLPKGIYRARVVGVVTRPINKTFNDAGEVEGLSRSLNRSVSVQELANSADAATKAKLTSLIQALNSLDSGLGNQLAQSNLYSDFETKAQIYLAALEYGISNKISLGIRMPVVRRSVQNRFSARTTNNASFIKSQTGALSAEMAAGLDAFSAQQLDTNFFESALFASKGYDRPRSFDDTAVGDLEFGGKYNFYRDDIWASSLLIGARAPTGKKASLTNKFDTGTSKEAWGVAAQALQEAELFRNFTLGGAAKYTINLPDTRQRAVPRDANDSLPSLLAQDGQVQNVRRVRGAELETELSAAYRFLADSVTVYSAYQYTQKQKDKFSGAGNLYYEGLAKGTDTSYTAAEYGVEYSTIPAFRKGKFAVPMEVALLYNSPIKGKNAPLNAYVRMDLMMYF
jgi:hypothetical protein